MGVLDQLNFNQQQKQVGNRYPFFGEGNHIADVLEFRHFNSTDRGLTICCDCVIAESDHHKPGTVVTAVYQVQRAPERASMTSDYDRLCDLLEKICGKPFGAGPELCKAVLSDAALASQPLRGARIRGFGAKPKAGKTFVSMTWTTIEQTESDIKSRRSSLDKMIAGGGSSTVAAPAAAASPPPARPAAPAGWEYGPDGNLRPAQTAASAPPPVPTTGALGALFGKT